MQLRKPIKGVVKHMEKRITALLLAALMIFSFSACGKKDTDNKTSQSDGVTTAAKVSDVKITPSEAKQTRLVDYKTSDFSMKIPEGWTVTTGGSGMFHAIRVTDPKNPINQISFLLKAQTILHRETGRSYYNQSYQMYGGNYNMMAAAPVLSPASTENFFKIFNSYAAFAKTYEASYSSFDFPSFGSFKAVESFASNSSMKSQAISPALLRATFTDGNGKSGEGLFTADVIDFSGNTASGFGIDAGFYMVYNIAAITCEKNSLIEWKDILCQSLSSIDYTQSYVSSAIQQSNESTANAMQIRNELSSISDGIMDSWKKRNTSQDIISQKQSDATLGLERIYDTEKDEIYMAKNGWSDSNKDERFQLVTDDSMYLKATSGTIE